MFFQLFQNACYTPVLNMGQFDKLRKLHPTQDLQMVITDIQARFLCQNIPHQFTGVLVLSFKKCKPYIGFTEKIWYNYLPQKNV